MSGTVNVVIARMVVVVSALCSCDNVLAYLTLLMGVLLVAPWRQRYIKRQNFDATGHPTGCPVRPCLIYLPLTPFFGVVKIRLKNSARPRVSKVAVAALYGHLTTHNWISCSQKGCCLVEEEEGDPVRSQIDLCLGVPG